MLFLIFLAFGLAASEPILKKCRLSDSECIRNTAQEFIPYFAAGLPEYNVPILDPYVTEEMDFSYFGLKFLLTDIVKTGLKSCQISKFTITDSVLETVMVCDMEVSANYEIDGKVLLVPLRSKGKSQMSMPKMQITGKSLLTEYTGSDGKKYWALKNFSRQFRLLEKATIKMDSLFGENSILSKTLNQLFNYYTNDVVYDKLPLSINNLVGNVDKSIRQFFEANSIDDLFE